MIIYFKFIPKYIKSLKEMTITRRWRPPLIVIVKHEFLIL